MNMELIRKQLEEITPPEMRFKQHVLQQIRIRRQNRRRHMLISAAIILLVVIIGTAQFQQIAAMAENMYRSIKLSLYNETLVIDNNVDRIPIEVEGLEWVGKQSNRVGHKSYTDSHAAQDELKIKLLHNARSNESALNFLYFEKENRAELILRHFFIGDLKNFKETILENGDKRQSYSSDQETVYKSPIDMKVSFFTAKGAEYKMDNLDTYNYEEKYVSPVNGITAYLLKDAFQATSDESSLLMYAAGSITEKLAVFVHDNLLYIISGNLPSSEMKNIIDAFVVEQ
jgi:outer membrane lipoprotein-sorting protein